MMKKLIALLLFLVLLPAALAEETTDNRPFALRYGDRNVKRICITMDDNYNTQHSREAFELCRQYNIPMTFFVVGHMLKPEDADFWRMVADSDCEIGNHTNAHNRLGEQTHLGVISQVLLGQQNLDALLGYHYGMVSLRPPFGNIRGENGSNIGVYRALKQININHVVMWDVADVDPKNVLRQVRNGSVLIFHAKTADVKCLEAILPVLVEEGYEFVTTAEMFDLGEIERSDEPFIYDKHQYMW